MISSSAEHCTGNFIFEGKNARETYDARNVEDVAYANVVWNLKDSHDIYSFYGPGELCYQVHSAGPGMFNSKFITDCWPSKNLEYCDHCFDCSDCFGCVGLRKKEYCIFNKQYSRGDYSGFRNRICEHMRQRNEYGEFFPIWVSPFAYNESVAGEEFPMAKEEALRKGYHWREEHEVEQRQQCYVIPDDIRDVPDKIMTEVMVCRTCGRNYKIILHELRFYRKLGLPIPRECFSCRHRRRMKLRNPRKLWTRNCDKCRKEFQTTYGSERAETIYCDACYLESVYD